MEKAIAAELDKATTSIDVAQYNFTSSDLSDALIRAKKRGVAIRVLFDQYMAKLSVSADVDLKAAGVPFNSMSPTGPVKALKFHHKFAVIDKSLVITGSYNWTESADEVNYENAVFIHDAAIVQPYAHEFESLWTTGKGGIASTGDVVFSPTGNAGKIQARIAQEIGAAQTEIVIAMYQFSSTTIAKAIAAAEKRGVKVTILTDAKEYSINSKSLGTISTGAQVKKVVLQGTGPRAPIIHDKFCVIDGKTVITGSFNWNVNQDLYGYENIVVLHDAPLAQQFLQTFSNVWSSSVAQ